MQLGPSSACRPIWMVCERAVTDVPLSCAPSPIWMRAPGPKVRSLVGAARVAAVARRQDEIMLTPAPMRISLPGQRMRPTGPWAVTPGPRVTPRSRALQRSRRVPQASPPQRRACRLR